MGVRVHLMFRSDDGGLTYSPITTNMFVTGENSTIEIVGIQRDNADVVYVRVTYAVGDTGDAIYRSLDAGQTWTKILEKLTSFVRRSRQWRPRRRDAERWFVSFCEPLQR